MLKRDNELWDALDRIFFGSNDPGKIRKEMEQLEKEFQWQRSSLGRYLRSLRRSHKRSLAQMAYKARVETSVWKAWEYDFETPSREALEKVMTRLKWSRLQREVAWNLWGEAARFRLKRLTTFQGDYLAAKGVASEANIAWQSISQESRQLVQRWGESRGYDFPKDLAEFLASFGSEEERESWVSEVLGESGE